MKKLLLSLLLASPTLLFAQGSKINTQSQKAVSMAGAGSALFIDEASIFYSPGALAKMRCNGISIGASTMMYRSTFREYNSTEIHHTKFKITPPFSVFATFGPKNSWWKAGIGVYTPFGGSVHWGTDWPGKYELNHLQMRAIYIQPTLSLKITDNFGIGGGFVYNVSQIDLSRSIPISMADGSSGQVNLSGTGTGIGYNLGVHYDLENSFSLSLSYRSNVVTKLKDGDAEFSVPPSLAASFPNTTFNTELPLPASFNFGISFPASSKVDIAADATFVGYDIYQSLDFDYADNTPVLTDTHQDKKYDNAFSGKVGVNYRTCDNLTLRAGVGYVFSPVRGPYVSPETPDNNRAMASAGFTYLLSDKWDLTAAYLLQQVQARTVTNKASGLSGTYKTTIHAPGISLTYKW
ncbi:OmpP1/FadL family transporter [Sphingobacterium lumbrici]|uniref:OmpP1/FadL family transporter n=1 Tax=Sphingobacterium lumbrici TaxID=2559600 RepID=UPI00112A0739|nr:outer membrane protein transport protein [Sphingobacterium lumbrici]